MNFSFMPSLEHIALVKIVSRLWNQEDIRDLIIKLDEHWISFDEDRFTQWQTIENKVMEKVPLLYQPGVLGEKISATIRPIGLQILEWVEYNRRTYDFTINLQNEIFWTPLGTVDRKKTAEALVRDKAIDISQRFYVASIYCLENDAEALWENMTESSRRLFYEEETFRVIEQLPRLFSWALNDNLKAFYFAVSSSNAVAVRHFWNKLTPAERKESIYNVVLCLDDVDVNVKIEVFLLVFTHFNEEQQRKIYKMSSLDIRLFLEWPWQNFCVEVANLVWDFLCVEDYCKLLKAIVFKVIDGFKDYSYGELFKELWKLSPKTHKNYVINHCASNFLLSMLFEIKDEKNISLILKDATPAEKENILFHTESIRICKSLVENNEQKLFKFFISECISSGEKMEKIMTNVKKLIQDLSLQRK